MTIKKLAEQLQEQIDERMEVFTSMGKKAKEMQQKLSKLQVQMGKVLQELEPVDSIIRAQHPEKCELFDLLLKLAEENNGNI